ncbi:MAG: cytochrome C oxidase subunit II, partial [Actinomycetota bacterium]|nr:cytochrome C oxidase subunit II [Actinomycetota bacterium]
MLVTAIGIFSAIVLARNDALGSNPLRINVTAQQFAWSFSYPGAKNLTTGTLRLPVNRSVLLTFDSKDVIHSFWVPEFGQKQDTVPGLHPRLHI